MSKMNKLMKDGIVIRDRNVQKPEERKESYQRVITESRKKIERKN